MSLRVVFKGIPIKGFVLLHLLCDDVQTQEWQQKERGLNDQLKIFQDELLSLSFSVEKSKLQLSQVTEERDALKAEVTSSAEQLQAEASKAASLTKELEVATNSLADVSQKHQSAVVELNSLQRASRETEEMLNMTVTQLNEVCVMACTCGLFVASCTCTPTFKSAVQFHLH